MTDLWTVLLLSLVALAGFWLLGRLVNRVTILEYQGGVRYARGRFSRVLGPGVYWLFRPFSRVEVVDLRRTLLQVAGQEILTKDQATVKVSLVADYEIAEPRQALHGTANYVEALHVSLQLTCARWFTA